MKFRKYLQKLVKVSRIVWLGLGWKNFKLDRLTNAHYFLILPKQPSLQKVRVNLFKIFSIGLARGINELKKIASKLDRSRVQRTIVT